MALYKWACLLLFIINNSKKRLFFKHLGDFDHFSTTNISQLILKIKLRLTF